MAKAYDVVPAEFKVSKSSWPRNGAATNHFMWFLPEFRRVFATGVDSALRFADSFRRHHGIRSTFVVSGRTHPARIKERIARAFPELAAASSVHVIDGGSNVSGLEASDAAIATGWTTAYSILRYNQARQKFYLLQDDESLLYPAGSVRGLVEATWGFGFRGICVTETLRDLYTARGGEAGFFTPCVDREFFFSRSAGESNEERPYTLCCHVQPNDSRTGFELVVEAIRILKRRLGDKVTVVTAAEPWVPEDFGIHGLMHNLGPIGHRATGALYRSCDVAVMMSSMAQAHDRALELMACGSLVVAGENPRMTWLLRNNDTCLLSPGTPSALAEALEEGLCNIALRRRITGRAGRMVREQYQDWDRSAETVFRYVCGHLAAAGS
jgi:glycosyltransferase involved in cell wall biosynthesis